jgi:hypothetical protein
VEPRVEDFLVARLATHREARFEGTAWDDPDVVIGALQAVDLLTGDEGVTWRAAFVSALLPGEPAGTEPEEELRERALSFMLERAGAGVPDDERHEDTVLRMLDALTELAVLTEEDQIAVQRRLEPGDWDDADDETFDEHASPGAGSGQWIMTIGPSNNMNARELRRVLVGPPQRRQGVRVSSVELYDDGVIARWHLAIPEPDYDGRVPELPDEVEPVELPRRPEFRLTDDLGTPYEDGSGGSTGRTTVSGVYVAEGRASFYPAVPSEARVLHLVSEGPSFEVVLG